MDSSQIVAGLINSIWPTVVLYVNTTYKTTVDQTGALIFPMLNEIGWRLQWEA